MTTSRADEHVLAEVAPRADPRARHDVAEVPDLRPVADLAAVVDRGGRTARARSAAASSPGAGASRPGSRLARDCWQALRGPAAPRTPLCDRRSAGAGASSDALEKVPALLARRGSPRVERDRLGRRPCTATGTPFDPVALGAGRAGACRPLGVSSKTAILRSPTTTSFCSLNGWSQHTKTWARTPLGEGQVLTVTSAMLVAAGSCRPGRPTSTGVSPSRRRITATSCGAKLQRMFSSRADLAEVEPVGVDVLDLAELAPRDQVLEASDRRVVLEQVPDHQDAAFRSGQRDQASPSSAVKSQGLLDEDILAGLQGLAGAGR